MTYAEIIITAFVVALVLFAMWRVGQLNPVGTGKLARRMNQLELRVAEQGQRMDGIERSVLLLAETSASTSTSIEAMRVELAADRGLTERTWSAVDRLQNYFIEDSFKRRDAK